MKSLRLPFIILFATIICSTGCQKNSREALEPLNANSERQSAAVVTGNSLSAREAGVCNSNAYIITLESKTQVNGNWEWTWSVQNSNPGTGDNGTVQDLSHWGMQFGTCVTNSSIVGAAYSANGTSWTSFTPVYQVDPSQGCMTTPVLKFDFGTTGSAKTYYKLVVNQNYEVGTTPGYYKSGKVTGCCTFNFTGIGCEDGPDR